MLHMLSIVALRTTNKPPAVPNSFNQQTYATYHVCCPFLLIALLSALVRRPSGGLYIILRIREHIRAHFPNTSPLCVCAYVCTSELCTHIRQTYIACYRLLVRKTKYMNWDWEQMQMASASDFDAFRAHTTRKPLGRVNIPTSPTTAGSVRWDF